MTSETVKTSQSSPTEGDKHKQLDKEIREMVHAITHRVTDFQRSASTHHLEDEDDHGMKVITLAGNNHGATLRKEVDEKSDHSDQEEDETLSTYVNSNFQEFNNSITLGGSYESHDPGVHLEISDFTEPHGHHKGEKHGKRGKKIDIEKKKEKEPFKSDREHSEHSDGAE
ncbi:hypothetical protein L6164_017424 [Bauhinia variegata]|uniref:Uncharacterized protein n=1 Tax=Bauhinia variegata TaxID=167791 RepID=A0ACB9N926_BAUVA|nr:hypothetical protein L6164_017424 [Bauhinia variegata]